jgi:hypothetical protein
MSGHATTYISLSVLIVSVHCSYSLCTVCLAIHCSLSALLCSILRTRLQSAGSLAGIVLVTTKTRERKRTAVSA